MHERQVVTVLVILISSGIFVTESFADTPQCNGLDATHVGTNDNDIIRGSSGNDVIVALGGNDIVYGMSGNDVICGGDGNDRLYGNSGNDILIGEGNLDILDGGHGVDMCDSSLDDKRVRSCETQFKELIDISGLQKQINDLQSQINSIIFSLINWEDIEGIPEDIANGDDDTLAEITCDTGKQILKFDGTNWVCGDLPTLEKDKVEIPIFFHPSTISGGQMQWLGTSDITSSEKAADSVAIVMAKPWIVSNLYVKTAESADSPFPGDNEIYTITVLKNEHTLLLSCSIINQETFCSDEKTAMIEKGETLVVKTESSFNALKTILRSSIILTSP